MAGPLDNYDPRLAEWWGRALRGEEPINPLKAAYDQGAELTTAASEQILHDAARNDSSPVPALPPPQPDPELMDILGGLTAAQQPPKMMDATATSVSKSITPAKYTPNEALAIQGVNALHRDSERTAETQRVTAADESRALIAKSIAEQQAYLDTVGGRADEAYKELQEATEKTASAARSLEEHRIDPNRMWEQMGTARQAMSIIGVALGGFVEGFTQGKVKNRAIGMIERAIDRDMRAQQLEFRKKLMSANLSRAQQNSLMSRYSAEEGRRRQAATQLVQLQLQKHSINSQDIEAKRRYAAVISGLDKSDVQAKADSRAKVVKQVSSTTRKVPVPQAGGVKADPKVMRKLRGDLEKYSTGEATLKRLAQKLTDAKGRPLVGEEFSQAAQSIRSDIRAAALFNRKLLGDSGPITDKDVKTFDRIATGVAGGRLMSARDMLKNVREMQLMMRQAKARAIKHSLRPTTSIVADAIRGGQTRVPDISGLRAKVQ